MHPKYNKKDNWSRPGRTDKKCRKYMKQHDHFGKKQTLRDKRPKIKCLYKLYLTRILANGKLIQIAKRWLKK